jgi:hypothetical protein
MTWKGTMIQLSNVSCVPTSSFEKLEFPKLTIGILLIGLLLFKRNALVGGLLIAEGIGWMYNIQIETLISEMTQQIKEMYPNSEEY